MLLCVPATIAVIYVRFPDGPAHDLYSFSLIAGPSNTAFANVTPPKLRASAFALNIFIIHLLLAMRPHHR